MAKKKTKTSSLKDQIDTELVEPEIIPVQGNTNNKAIAPADPVTAYMAQIRKYPLLTKEQEKELAIKYFENKETQLAEVLVTSNLRFVVKIAAEYAKYGARLIDLIQEGNVGLMHAVKEYNPYKGARLITYAVWWIRGYISEYLMKQYSLVRIGTTQAQRKLFYQLQKERDALEKITQKELGHQETVQLLSGKLGVSEADIESMSQRMSGRDVSLDQPINSSDGNSSLMDFQSGLEDDVDDLMGHLEQIHLLKEKISDLRPNLNPREIELLDDRLLSDDPLTLQEIGEKYKISREAVRQMEARLIKKIRQLMVESEEQ